MERINAYDIHHAADKAWNTFSNEVDALIIDFYIVTQNKQSLGEIPNDIRKNLFALVALIQEN